jgi:hypothetical protein
LPSALPDTFACWHNFSLRSIQILSYGIDEEEKENQEVLRKSISALQPGTTSAEKHQTSGIVFQTHQQE